MPSNLGLQVHWSDVSRSRSRLIELILRMLTQNGNFITPLCHMLTILILMQEDTIASLRIQVGANREKRVWRLPLMLWPWVSRQHNQVDKNWTVASSGHLDGTPWAERRHVVGHVLGHSRLPYAGRLFLPGAPSAVVWITRGGLHSH